jgi:hypothetical protein
MDGSSSTTSTFAVLVGRIAISAMDRRVPVFSVSFLRVSCAAGHDRWWWLGATHGGLDRSSVLAR